MNPANNKDIDYEGRVREYQSYLREIDNISQFNHANVAKFEEAFRNKDGNLFIILEMFDETLYDKRKVELGGDKQYDETILLDILR